MFEWRVNDRHFVIREACRDSDYRGVEQVQREAWQCSDLDVVGALMLIASQHAGAILLCAFEGDEMIGFTYGIPALESSQLSIHSHMAAVRECWRGREFQVGFYLKRAQRTAALARGIAHITWTFDPLQSLNAYFNFVKLGVICSRYCVNFYGDSSTSPLHQGFGTDRLWVDWFLESERVISRVATFTERLSANQTDSFTFDHPAALLIEAEDQQPRVAEDRREKLSRAVCFIEIPPHINAVKERLPELGKQWREATREAFLQALEAGFTISDFHQAVDGNRVRWFYRLTR
ncbi:MAG: hypothetical protein HY231_20245 [Acidobacteria bacterium]|nr:hypothetical protein [Acidobacteriota bacterium]